MNFRLKEDWQFGDKVVLRKGEVISPNDDFKYIIDFLGTDMVLSINDIESNNIFEKVDELDIDISEVSIEEDEIIKKYRIQMDIRTSLSKLKVIERFLRDNINNML